MKKTTVYTNSLVTLRAWINRLEGAPNMKIERVNYNWYVYAYKANGEQFNVVYDPTVKNQTIVERK